MSGFVYRSALGCALFSLAFPAGAQQQAAPKTVWNLEWVDQHCAVTTGSPESLGLSLGVTPGDPEPQLTFSGPQAVIGGKLPAKANIVLQPGGQSFEANAYARGNGRSQRTVLVGKLDPEFLTAFAKAEEVRLVTAKSTLAVPVKGAGKAAAAMQQCLDVKLADWGMDSKAYLALRRPPVQVAGQVLIAGSEYPGIAIANNEEGRVIARLDVGPDGKVTKCAVVVSSSSMNLDRATCTIAAIRWRFYPAIAADGSPTAAQRIMSVEYRLVDSTRPDLFKGMSDD